MSSINTGGGGDGKMVCDSKCWTAYQNCIFFASIP